MQAAPHRAVVPVGHGLAVEIDRRLVLPRDDRDCGCLPEAQDGKLPGLEIDRLAGGLWISPPGPSITARSAATGADPEALPRFRALRASQPEEQTNFVRDIKSPRDDVELKHEVGDVPLPSKIEIAFSDCEPHRAVDPVDPF